jgi:hypothetical protein
MNVSNVALSRRSGRGQGRPGAPRVPRQRSGPATDELLPALSAVGTAPRMVAVALAWAISLAASTAIDPVPWVHDTALAVHLLAFVVSYGAVVVVEWHGALWMLDRRTLAECSRLAAGASPLIWAGVAGLLVSGAMLQPDLTHPPTQVKLALVLLVGLNGAALSTTRRTLGHRPTGERPGTLPRSLLTRMFAAATVSQTVWWGAATLGFLVTAGRL